MSREKGDSGKPRSAVGRDTNIAQSIGSGTIHGNMNSATVGSLTVVNPFAGSVNTLPPDVNNFVGRRVESEHLVSLLRGGEPNVIVISGMAGSGKSVLSLHAAHTVADSYPDGLLWASLRPHGDEVRAAEDILDLLLRDLGIPPDLIPPDLEARSALYRSLLHQRRILIVIDGATSAQQVLPLLPPTSASVVIITSRSRLVSLHNASHIDLNVFTPLESVDLLQRYIGPRPELDHKALQRIAELCGHLPLAIAIAGALLRRRPHISVGAFAAELADKSMNLDRLDVGEVNVRAAFDLSYSQLDQALAKAFRLLSWFPGPTIETAAAAALLDTSIQLTQRWLDQLVDRHLINLQSHRYRYHDLLRAYAQEASKADFPDDRTAALVRLRNWYLNRAQHAVTALTAATVDRSGAVTRNEALAWLEDERMNVLSLAAETVTSQQATYVWELSDTLYPFYDLRGHWTDCQAIQELALQVARSAQNQTAAGRILNNLGVAYREQHQYTACISCLEESITLSRSTGSRETTALALMNLGVAHHGIGQLLEAATCLESALSLSRELGLDAATRQILGNLGNAYSDMSRRHDALNAYREALDLCRSANDRRGEGVVLVNLGTLYREQGFLDEALACLSQSLEITRDMLDRVSEGRALQNLGSVSAARGASDEAIAELEASARIADQARDVETVYLACLGLGDIYLSRDNTREARNWYEACQRAGQEIGDLKREAKVITALAAVADRDNEAELALTYRRHAVTLLRDSSDRRSLASALSGAGSALINLSQAPEALVCFEEAAAIARDLSDPRLELEALKLLADVLPELGQDSDVSAVRRRIDEIGGLLPT